MKNDIIIIIGISGNMTKNGLQELCSIDRLNSGNRNRHDFFMSAIFLLDQKIENDSVNHASVLEIQNFGLILGAQLLKLRGWRMMQMPSNAYTKVKK